MSVTDRFESAKMETRAAARNVGFSFDQALGARTIGRGLVTVALVVVILNQVLTISVINNSTGPFSGVITTIENLGSAALTLVTLGFLVLGGAIAMRFMDRF